MWAILQKCGVAPFVLTKHMLENYDNKQIGNKDFKSEESLHTKKPETKRERVNAIIRTKKRGFYFPGKGVTVKAESLDDASQKLKHYKKSNRNK